mgnify:CR=1 FL=1
MQHREAIIISHLIVDIPTKLNQEQKDALMAYEKALTGNERHGKKKGLFGK